MTNTQANPAPSTKLPKLHVDFDTRSYERTYQHAPRGRGSWAFDLGDGVPWFTPGSTLYGEAKKLAKAEIARRVAGPEPSGAKWDLDDCSTVIVTVLT